MLVSGWATAAEMERPTITLSTVDWAAAAASLPDRGTDTPAQAFASLSAISARRFTGVEKSSVPVLLPFDIAAFRKDIADGKAEAATSDKYFGSFHPTKYFLPGAAGYDATFVISPDDAPGKTRYGKPIMIEKPLAHSVEIAENLSALSRQHKAPIYVAYHKRSDLASVAAAVSRSISRPAAGRTWMVISLPTSDCHSAAEALTIQPAPAPAVLGANGSMPMSYIRRLSVSDSTSYAWVISLNRSCVCGSGFTSGCSSRASRR